MRPIRNHSPGSMSDKENSPDGSVLRRTRRRLQERFENQYAYEDARSPARSGTERSWNGFALPSAWAGVPVPQIPARVLRSGANTLSKTLNSVQTTFDTLSQKFRRSTKRRQQLKNEPSCSPVTPQSKSRHILGRTPTKLYSPFGIETPCRRLRGKENEYDKARISKDRSTLQKKLDYPKANHSTCESVNETVVVEKKFDPDMEEVRISIWELRQTAHRIVKHSSVQH